MQKFSKFLSFNQSCGFVKIDVRNSSLEPFSALYPYSHLARGGNDINIDTHPFKAGLGWITSLEKGDFIGREEIILKRDDEESKLVYFEMLEKSIPRPGFDIIVNGKVVGFVTSGTISPSLNKGIGIAYVDISHTKKGTELSVKIRNKLKSAVVVKAPFYSNGTLSN